LLLTCSAGRGAAQVADAVERLRQVLRSVGDPAQRDLYSRACIEGLRGLNDLCQALLLPEWRDAEGGGLEVDRANRAVVRARLGTELRRGLRGPDPVAAAEALDLLARLGAAERSAGRPPDLPRLLAADVADVAVRGPLPLRPQAARTLAQVGAPELAASALAELLHAPDPASRLAGAEGLLALVQTLAQERGRAAVTADRRTAILIGCQVVPVLAAGLTDGDPGVRRRCVAAAGPAAAGLTRLLSAATPADPAGDDAEARRLLAAEREALRPLALALGGLASGLARNLRDGDTALRLDVQKALEELGLARSRWLAQGPAADDPLAEGLTLAVPALAESLGQADVGVRLSALDALGVLGPLAGPAAPAVVRALGDPDRFVRRAAVRVLRGLGVSGAVMVPALQRLLQDPDVDVRQAAAAALEQFAPPR
jgi:hypothetical protein